MKKIGIISIAILAFVSSSNLMVLTVLARPETSTISASCVAAQSILSQIQKADTGSRINRGHDYTEILSLMFAMNARLSVNKIAAPILTDLAMQFEQNIAQFRSDYDEYDKILTSALRAKCINNPNDFYDNLESSRAARKVLKQNVAALDQIMNDYSSRLNVVLKESE